MVERSSSIPIVGLAIHSDGEVSLCWVHMSCYQMWAFVICWVQEFMSIMGIKHVKAEV